MSNPFVAKLASVVPLSSGDRAALEEICANRRVLPADSHIVHQGDRPSDIHLVLDGWAAHYQLLENGSRQITSFLLAGDICDQHASVLGEMDHSICTITSATIAYLPAGRLEEIAAIRPNIARALWWSALVDEAILRAWIVTIGRRNAYASVSHLLCELHARLRNVELVSDHHFTLPLTQDEIADALGLSAVHVNRILMRLRREGLLTLSNRILTIPDMARLRAVAGFNEAYLHRRPGRPVAV